MFDLPLFTANGAFCAAALVVAAFVHRGRGEALTLAALLFANFVFCALAYTPYAPKLAFAAVGITVTSKDLWLLADAVYGTCAVFAFRRWWGWGLWGLSSVQVALHIAYQWGLLDADAYTDRLQNVLHAQLAVFFLIGGPGAVDFLRCHAARFCRHCMVAAQAVRTAFANTR